MQLGSLNPVAPLFALTRYWVCLPFSGHERFPAFFRFNLRHKPGPKANGAKMVLFMIGEFLEEFPGWFKINTLKKRLIPCRLGRKIWTE